jgi:hypothetical protein
LIGKSIGGTGFSRVIDTNHPVLLSRTFFWEHVRHRIGSNRSQIFFSVGCPLMYPDVWQNFGPGFLNQHPTQTKNPNSAHQLGELLFLLLGLLFGPAESPFSKHSSPHCFQEGRTMGKSSRKKKTAGKKGDHVETGTGLEM